MIELLKSIASSGLNSTMATGGNSVKNAIAPAVLGGSVIAGVVSAIIGVHKIVDCLRYQTKHAQCDSAIETNLPAVVAGTVAVFGCWGGFNTYNPGLRREEQAPEIQSRELVIKEPAMEPQILAEAGEEVEVVNPVDVGELVRSAVRQQIAEMNSRRADRGR